MSSPCPNLITDYSSIKQAISEAVNSQILSTNCDENEIASIKSNSPASIPDQPTPQAPLDELFETDVLCKSDLINLSLCSLPQFIFSSNSAAVTQPYISSQLMA